MTQLNVRVSGDDPESPRDVARSWLAEQGFIAGT
jgi:glycine betaine/choline ABC-type transport system substrate-binding protein